MGLDLGFDGGVGFEGGGRDGFDGAGYSSGRDEKRWRMRGRWRRLAERRRPRDWWLWDRPAHPGWGSRLLIS